MMWHKVIAWCLSRGVLVPPSGSPMVALPTTGGAGLMSVSDRILVLDRARPSPTTCPVWSNRTQGGWRLPGGGARMTVARAQLLVVRAYPVSECSRYAL